METGQGQWHTKGVSSHEKWAKLDSHKGRESSKVKKPSVTNYRKINNNDLSQHLAQPPAVQIGLFSKCLWTRKSMEVNEE